MDTQRFIRIAFSLALGILLVGCAHPPTASESQTVAPLSGSVHGGQQPISNAAIQVYAVGTVVDGGPATPLLTTPVMTDSSGAFTLTGNYVCPSASTLVYLSATGGNPGLAQGTNNSSVSLLAALGPCGSLTTSTFINVNEISTVAAVYALSPYMTSLSNIGSVAAESASLQSAFSFASELADTATGTAPGANVPSGVKVPVAQINAVADVLATCINSSGGTAGDGSACGTLFSLLTPANAGSPADTVSALINLANQPSLNTQALYNLISPTGPFQPAPSQAPADFSIHLNVVVPVVVAVTPATTPAGAADLTLDLQGSGFFANSAVFWNQTALTTQRVSANELTATVPASLTAGSNVAQIVVLTPGGGQSSSATFSVTAPVPTLTAISPQAVSVGQAATVTLTGTGFIPNSTVEWNGSAHPTTFISSTALRVILSTSETSVSAVGHLSVFNPPPSGGTSPALPLTVTSLPIPAITGITLSTSTNYSGCAQISATVTGTNFDFGNTKLQVNGQTLTTTSIGINRLFAYLPAGFSGTAANTSFVAATVVGGTSVPSNVFALPSSSPPLLLLCATSNSATIYPASQFRLTFSASQWNLANGPSITSITLPIGFTTANAIPFNLAPNGVAVLFAAGKSLQAGTYSIPFTGTGGNITATGNATATVNSGTPPMLLITSGQSNQLGVPIGGSASFGLYAVPNQANYTSEMSVSGLPPGTTASVIPSTIVAGDSFTLTITAAANAPTSQNVPVLITATPDAAAAPASVTSLVDVTPPPGSLPANRSDFVSTGATPYAIVYNRAQDVIYISNPRWNRIDIMSNQTHALVKSIPLRGPQALDLSQDGSTLWIGTESQQIFALNTSNFALSRYNLPTVAGTRWVDDSLFAMSDGTLLLNVTSQAGSGNYYNIVWNSQTNSVTLLISYSIPFMMRTGDGTKAIGANVNSSVCQPVVYSVATQSIATLPTLDERCNVTAVNQDGSVLVAMSNGHWGLYNGSFQLIGTLPTNLASAGINTYGGFVFSTDGKTLYQISQGFILTMDVASLTLKGTAPAISTVPVGVSETPNLSQPVAVDITGMIIGIQGFGIEFDDSTFFQNYGANQSGQAYPVFLSPNVGPINGGTTSSPYGNYSLVPDVWYGANRGSANFGSGTLNIVSPPTTLAGPVNLKYIFPSGDQVFTPQAFSYGPYPTYATLAGADPNGGTPGQIAGYGMPADASGGTATVGGAPATITTQITQYPPYTGEPFPSTFLKFTIPPGTPGYADFQVTTPNGTGTLPTAIFYAKSVADYASIDTFKDVLYDSSRNQLYLSAGDHIDVFSLASNKFLTPLIPATNGSNSSFRGLSLTPDYSLLLAANMTDGSLGVISPDTPAQTFAISVQAATGTSTTCATGPFSVAGLSGQSALVSAGLPPLVGGCSNSNNGLYSVNLQAKSSSLIRNSCVGILEATSDGSRAIIGTLNGSACLYTAATNTFAAGPVGAATYLGATVSGDGNIAAVGNTFSDINGNGLGFVGHPVVYGSVNGVYPQNNYPAGLLYRPRLNASGSLYYWAYPNYFDIIDGQTGNLRLRFSLSETVQNVETPIAIDGGGRRIFLITNAGLTIVDLGNAPMSIGSLKPATGAGGTQIQVRGSGFVSGCVVVVGGSTATSTFIDENTLTATLPTLSSGPHDVTITKPDGTSYTLYSGVVYP